MNVNVSSFTDKLFSSDVDIVLNVHNKQRDYTVRRESIGQSVHDT